MEPFFFWFFMNRVRIYSSTLINAHPFQPPTLINVQVTLTKINVCCAWNWCAALWHLCEYAHNSLFPFEWIYMAKKWKLILKLSLSPPMLLLLNPKSHWRFMKKTGISYNLIGYELNEQSSSKTYRFYPFYFAAFRLHWSTLQRSTIYEIDSCNILTQTHKSYALIILIFDLALVLTHENYILIVYIQTRKLTYFIFQMYAKRKTSTRAAILEFL